MAASLNILGIGSRSAGRTRGATTVTLSSIYDPTSNFEVTAFVLNALTSTLPSFTTSIQWEHLQGLLLADPDFLRPGPIDVIIGADSYGLLVEPEIIKGRATEPIAQRTLLGWIVLGPINDSTSSSVRIQHTSIDDKIDLLLSKFWEQEEIPSDSAPTPEPEEASCEQHFKDTHTRDNNGRYVVRLPFKASPSSLGDSFAGANRCLHQLLRRLSTNNSYRDLYNDFLQEYETLSHMARATNANTSRPRFYLPHHGVFRAHSTTTKLRVVFNGSFKTTSGVSINDILHTGAKLQRDTADVLLWIRRHRFIFATDVTKMFRQIAVHPDDWALQQILWVDSENQVVPYYLTTVTYGLSCAPFLAIRVMLQLVEDEGHNFPSAISPLTKGRYVDDIFGGADNLQELQETARQLQEICQRGCFPLQKWSANVKDALQHVTSESRTDAVSINSEDPDVKLLGIVWNSTEDNFKFTLQPSFHQDVTKRTVLSETASLFDPLGFISPVTVKAKAFLQELWLAKLHWDDELSATLHEKWLRFRASLSDLSLISLPRWLHLSSASKVELHGFSDASLLAMAAVVYLRSTSADGKTTVILVCSKTKVAPLKRLTIPRLELSAALLLARLMSSVQRTLELSEVPVSLWTDAEVALTWITSPPSRWKDFVRNRVASIQELTSKATWRYVAGKQNPADCASRGMTPRQLSTHRLWWDGPEWLSLPQTSWPSTSPNPSSDPDLEQRPGFAFVTTSDPEQQIWDLLGRYSSLTRLLRITAVCKRAVARFRRLPHTSMSYPLTPGEVDEARHFWIRLVQQTYFTAEVKILSNGPLHKSSPLAALTPFIDQLGTLRVGGRLKHSPLQPEAKHPPILPRTSRLTTLVISEAHSRTLHGGTQSTLSYLRQSYWILGGRAPVRAYILRCTTCARLRGLRAQQLMGQLPPARVTPSRAFLHSGLDYAGPFTIKTWRGRAAKTYKGYLAVFVCFATSAVHFELVTDYTSEAFIAAYRRFTGRRGICHTLYSDCGTNFAGADAELRALFKAGSAEMDSTIVSLTNLGTAWSFNPPAAPHMGGKWEAAVKSAKFHLRRVIGDASLTYEEFTTLLTQVEAILNSRPLCPLSDDPEDTSPLTPGHFTIGEALTTVPEPSLISIPKSRLSRWQFLQATLQHFWQRWSTEYLQRSLSISKWHHPSHEIQLGSLVLITDERLPPSRWPLARVIELHPGSDGLTRVVTLRTATSTFKRPTSKLAVLPVDSSTTTVAEGGENVQDSS